MTGLPLSRKLSVFLLSIGLVLASSAVWMPVLMALSHGIGAGIELAGGYILIGLFYGWLWRSA